MTKKVGIYNKPKIIILASIFAELELDKIAPDTNSNTLTSPTLLKKKKFVGDECGDR
jgi:hypothetical protein